MITVRRQRAFRSRSLCRAAGRMRQGNLLRRLASLGLDPRPVRRGFGTENAEALPRFRSEPVRSHDGGGPPAQCSTFEVGGRASERRRPRRRELAGLTRTAAGAPPLQCARVPLEHSLRSAPAATPPRDCTSSSMNLCLRALRRRPHPSMSSDRGVPRAIARVARRPSTSGKRLGARPKPGRIERTFAGVKASPAAMSATA